MKIKMYISEYMIYNWLFEVLIDLLLEFIKERKPLRQPLMSNLRPKFPNLKNSKVDQLTISMISLTSTHGNSRSAIFPNLMCPSTLKIHGRNHAH